MKDFCFLYVRESWILNESPIPILFRRYIEAEK